MPQIHPLTGEPKNGKARNGHVRPELVAYFGGSKPTRQAKLSIDAARSGNDLDNHWQFSDALDADGAYSKSVRHTLIKRSRYETTSNAFYAGIIDTHCNMLVGVGPTLRMLTGNRNFNQLIEREWHRWTLAVQFRRKLWAMAHAVTGDGDTLAILQNNPAVPENLVQLDFLPIEAEQCQSSYEGLERGRCDGIIYDENNNVVGYEILPYHPGSTTTVSWADPVFVPASQVVHWFKLKRPGAHRGIPALTSGLNTGAYHRRFREATVAAAETAADVGAMLTSTLGPAGDSEPDPVAPFSTVEFVKRMLMVAPMGWDAKQMKGEHPNAQYAEFHRTLLSELARGISMPYNAAACDSSTYSFASGKLDTLCYRAALDVERADCNDLILDPIFTAWFREWRAIPDADNERRNLTPAHQWDWPKHPVIDDVADANAINTRLNNSTLTFTQACSDAGKDAEDEYTAMAMEVFGNADGANLQKCRQIVALKHTPQHAIQYVAQILGVEMPAPKQPGGPPNAEAV